MQAPLEVKEMPLIQIAGVMRPFGKDLVQGLNFIDE